MWRGTARWRWRGAALAALLAAVALGWAGPAAPGAADGGEVAPGRVIVKLRPGRTASAASAAASVGALAVEPRAAGVQVWHVAPGEEREAARQLATRPDVELAEPDRIVRALATATDPLYASHQW